MIRLEVPAVFTKICTEREYTPAGATPFQKEADLALAEFGGQKTFASTGSSHEDLKRICTYPGPEPITLNPNPDATHKKIRMQSRQRAVSEKGRKGSTQIPAPGSSRHWLPRFQQPA